MVAVPERKMCIRDRNWIMQNSDLALAVLFLILTSVPFYLTFDKRKAQARDLVPVALMAAMCVVGRAAFSIVPLPNFKPVTAIVKMCIRDRHV